ncbi:MAG: zinc ribbon domain-containing protein [Oscillospiraceae bacterium]|jgi:putative FmdB family regulatory protein|nr:zinc ribbon domain-containing protein [Oscillospiraceae bacterium]
MPFYDLICKTCGQEASIRATVADKTEGRVPCPSCGSFDLASAFKRAPSSVVKAPGNAAAECPRRHVCGGSCPH